MTDKLTPEPDLMAGPEIPVGQIIEVSTSSGRAFAIGIHPEATDTDLLELAGWLGSDVRKQLARIHRAPARPALIAVRGTIQEPRA